MIRREGAGPSQRGAKAGAPSASARPGRSGKGSAPVRDPATERILAVLKAIPRGKVAAYGQVAALAGMPRGARQVARILHSLSKAERLPWHRVLGASGRISLPAEAGGAEQARRLAREGVKVGPGGRVDRDRYGWRP